MLTWFRRRRLLAALLIAVNPALVGSWVAAYHPCPVRDGAVGRWGAAAADVAPAAVSEHAGHEGMMVEEPAPAAPSHDHSGSDAPCTCIGQCLASGIALPSFAGNETRIAVVVTQSAVRSPRHASAPPATRPLDLLPPSTAPPIA